MHTIETAERDAQAEHEAVVAIRTIRGTSDPGERWERPCAFAGTPQVGDLVALWNEPDPSRPTVVPVVARVWTADGRLEVRPTHLREFRGTVLIGGSDTVLPGLDYGAVIELLKRAGWTRDSG